MNENTKLFHDILEEINQGLEGNFRIEVSDEDGCFSLRLVKTFESNIKEKIALFKWIIGMMIAIVIAIAGWVLNKFQINENVLISVALAVMVLLSIISILLFRKIIALIDEVAKIKK